MPAIVRWSRSSECSGRGVSSSSHSSSPPADRATLRGRAWRAPRPARARAARSSLTHAACFEPNSRRRSSRPSRRRTSSREVRSRGPARLSYSCRRPADIRWISSASSPSVSTIRCLPRRRTPVTCRPSSADSGGSNVFSALMPGASADSISRLRSARSSSRAVISTSGSSGIALPSRRRAMPGSLSSVRARSGGPSYLTPAGLFHCTRQCAPLVEECSVQ